MIENAIKTTFGLKCKAEEIQLKGFPMYMISGRKAWQVSMEDMVFLLIEVGEQEKFGAIALQKQLVQFREKLDMDIAYSFSSLTRVQRDALITKGIPFVSMPDQIYLPFLGVLLSGKFRKKTSLSMDRMMPATQSLFLYMLYYGASGSVIKKEAAEKLGLTRTSISRASEQLEKMHLISEKRVEKEIHMRTTSTGLDLYEKAKGFLINPVQKTMYVQMNHTEGLSLAGESALSRQTMLGSPKQETYAAYKGDKSLGELKEVDPQWQEESEICRIELWKYDPALFSKNGEVDPVSLAMSLQDNEDERVQGELQKYLEGYEW